MQRALSWIRTTWHDQHERDLAILAAVGFVATFVIMVVPLWFVTSYSATESVALGASVGTAGVGIGAIFRSLSRDLLRTSLGVASRTAARAVSRHWTHVLIQWVARKTRRGAAPPPTDGTPHPYIAIAAGAVGLALSYGFVLTLLPADAANAMLGGIPLWVVACGAAAPLIVYYAISMTAGKLLNVRVAPRTEIDGLLMQLYFTLAVSFLPLTSDGEYSGSPNRRAWVAAISIAGLFAIHLALGTIGTAIGMPFLEHLGVLFLLQAFVLAFPFEPLDGKHLWSRSKLAWCAVWAPMAIAFHYRIPTVFYELI